MASHDPGAPGWYDDPDGRSGLQRYWNGEKWTGAPREKPPEATWSGLAFVVVATVLGVVIVGAMAFNWWF